MMSVNLLRIIFAEARGPSQKHNLRAYKAAVERSCRKHNISSTRKLAYAVNRNPTIKSVGQNPKEKIKKTRRFN